MKQETVNWHGGALKRKTEGPKLKFTKGRKETANLRGNRNKCTIIQRVNVIFLEERKFWVGLQAAQCVCREEEKGMRALVRAGNHPDKG